ncbi:MAG TPA: SMI1/KNR4 family protein [Flavobacterium sp.]|jgi:hypothetical protein
MLNTNKIKFLYSKQKLTREELRGFEQQLNMKLPDSYTKLIQEYNGGAPEKDYFKGKWVIFNSIKYGKNPIEKTIETMKRIIPNNFFPFAHDPGGWLFCIDLKQGEEYGKIYFYRLDQETEEEAIELLAESFEEFMDGLSDNPDD